MVRWLFHGWGEGEMGQRGGAEIEKGAVIGGN